MSQEIERLRDLNTAQRRVRRDSDAFNSGAFGATAMPSTVHIRRYSGVRCDSDAFDVTVMPFNSDAFDATAIRQCTFDVTAMC